MPAGDHSTSHQDIAWSFRERCDRVISSRQASQHRFEASPRHRCGEAGGDDACGKAERVADLMQVITKVTNERCFGVRTGQKTSIGRQRIKGTKESEAFDEFTHKRVHGDHTFRFEFAERHVDCPLTWARRAKAVRGQIGTLTDAHAGVANQTERHYHPGRCGGEIPSAGVHPVLQ